jgi:hypothetical protein
VHGPTGRWNLSGRSSVFGARERGVKPSTRDDDHRRVEPQVIHSPLNTGKPMLPIQARHQPEGQHPEEPAGEKAQAAKLRFSPKARDRTAPPRPSSQQRCRAPWLRGEPRTLLARPALPGQANSPTRHATSNGRGAHLTTWTRSDPLKTPEKQAPPNTSQGPPVRPSRRASPSKTALQTPQPS